MRREKTNARIFCSTHSCQCYYTRTRAAAPAAIVVAATTIILIDITVANCNILAAKPAAQFQNNPMPVNEAMKIIWWENLNADRLNNLGIFCFTDSGAL